MAKQWSQWAEHVFAELARFDELCQSSSKRLREIEKELAVMKYKIGLWSAVGASIPVIATVLVLMLKSML